MSVLRALLLTVAAAFAAPAGAQEYPNRPIRLIVPFAAGQGADAAARIVAQRVSERLGQPIVIENRPGAGGNIGAEAAARAPADGYTLLVGSNGTHAANAALYDSLPFDPQNDFTAVAYLGSVPMVLIAAPTSPLRDAPELIRLARERPQSVSVAIPSSTSRVVFELLRQLSGAELDPVAYRASAAALADVLGGHVQTAIDTLIATLPQIRAGRLRALAVSSAARTAVLPDVPTLREAGVAGFDLAAWNVLFAPRNTPGDVVTRLNREIVAALQEPEVQQRLRQLGYEPGGADEPAQVAAFIASEMRKWGDLIRRAGIRAE
jgi:tripartite-type tricarboxylate transporter receptor subunit TctC